MKKYFIVFSILFILVILAIGLYFANNLQEGLDTNQTSAITDTDPIPAGYYSVSTDGTSRTIAKIPYGYTVIGDPTKGVLQANTNAAQYTGIKTDSDADWSKTSVNTAATAPDGMGIGDYNKLIQYNASSTDGSYNHYQEKDDTQQANTWILDKDGKKISVPWSSVKGDITYYKPGTYPYGPSSYVPNYEDSVYLSRTTGMSTVTPVYNTASMMGGFCTQYKDKPDQLEQVCNSTDLDKCGSTSCCVLLGGTKCVAGDEKGPTMKVNYSDIFVRNKDVYYYQGKCYGNC